MLTMVVYGTWDDKSCFCYSFSCWFNCYTINVNYRHAFFFLNQKEDTLKQTGRSYSNPVFNFNAPLYLPKPNVMSQGSF